MFFFRLTCLCVCTHAATTVANVGKCAFKKVPRNTSTLCMWMFVCAYHTFKHPIQPQMSSNQAVTNPHLCAGSVLLHMWELAPIPQPLHYHPPPWALPEWLTDGRISHDKKLKWLITEAHLCTWGSLAYQGWWAPRRCTSHSLSCHPGADSPTHGPVWSSSLFPVCVYVCALSAPFEPETYIVQPGDKKIN